MGEEGGVPTDVVSFWLMPLRFRRLILALRYLRYLILLQPRHYARCAFEDSLDLARTGRSGWVGDLAIALGRLEHPVHFDFMADVTVDVVDRLTEEVEASSELWVRSVLNSSPKTWLLKDRVEIKKNGSTDASAILFRHYLRLMLLRIGVLVLMGPICTLNITSFLPSFLPLISLVPISR